MTKILALSVRWPMLREGSCAAIPDRYTEPHESVCQGAYIRSASSTMYIQPPSPRSHTLGSPSLP